MVGVGIRIWCPLPDTLEKWNGVSRTSQPVERQPPHLDRFDIRRILGHGFGKGLLRIDQFSGAVVGNAQSTAGSFHWRLLCRQLLQVRDGLRRLAMLQLLRVVRGCWVAGRC